jgi:hypothetical protein
VKVGPMTFRFPNGAAFRNGRGAKTLYRLGMSAEEVEGLSVEELRRRMGVPADGVANKAERKLAWAAAS